MKKLLCVLLGGLTSGLMAYDWPSTDMQIVRSFGQRASDTALPGVEVQTLSPLLASPENGDVVFVFQPGSQVVQNLPSGLGGFVALAHEDNLRTVVTRVTTNDLGTKRSFVRGEPLGTAEVQPGASESRHRIFVFDQQLGELVNPLLVFPALADERSPIVLDVRAAAEGQSASVSLLGQSSLAVGYWDLGIVVFDPVTLFPAPGKDRGPEAQRGVYAVEAYLNGTEVFNTALDSILEKDGRWQVKGLGRFLQDVMVRDQEWRLGQVFFNQGTNILELVVRDFHGNQAGRTFRILGVR